MSHKAPDELERALNNGRNLVKVGGRYSHYKGADKIYLVIGLGIQEATGQICIIYQAEYNPKLTFVRDLNNWIEEPEIGVARFRLLD